MITINHLLDLGILNDNNYQYTYDDEYDKIIDYAYKHESDELNKRLIIISATCENCCFQLTIKPDDYLIRRYKQSIETKAMEAISTIRKICKETENCKLCPFFMEDKEKCKFSNVTPYKWEIG